jgi:hypothetical protein
MKKFLVVIYLFVVTSLFSHTYEVGIKVLDSNGNAMSTNLSLHSTTNLNTSLRSGTSRSSLSFPSNQNFIFDITDIDGNNTTNPSWYGVTSGDYIICINGDYFSISLPSSGDSYCTYQNGSFYVNSGPMTVQPVITISGPSTLNYKQTGTFTATSTLDLSLGYLIWSRKDGSGSWSEIAYDVTSINAKMLNSTFTLKFELVDYNITAYKSVSQNTSASKENTNLSDNLNYEFNLANNFPNPFNPSTKISYSITQDGYVSLKVFDILGNEISELVANYQSAGVYEVEFNASNLPSGTYIYRLEAENQILTKQMILVK